MTPSNYKSFRLKRPQVSFLFEKKPFLIMLLLTIILFSIMIISLSTGSVDVPFNRVIMSLLGKGNPVEHFTIVTLRLPRILLGMFAGIGLALSGAILQGLVRNPLASPDIIGVNSGASIMAVLFITKLSPYLSIHFLPLFAFMGSILTVLILYLLAWKNGVTPFRLILVGFGITAILGATQTLLMISGDITSAGSAYTWLTGSLHATKWYEVQIVILWMLLLVPTALILTKALNLQQVGDEITISLGGKLQYLRILLVLVAACLAAISVAFAGGIGFIGLMAPHISRKLVGTSYGQLLPCSALIGAILVVLSDWIGRTWFGPLDIPVGVFTSLIGAPFFLYLFITMGKK